MSISIETKPRAHTPGGISRSREKWLFVLLVSTDLAYRCHSILTNGDDVSCWHVCDMPTSSSNVRSQGLFILRRNRDANPCLVGIDACASSHQDPPGVFCATASTAGHLSFP